MTKKEFMQKLKDNLMGLNQNDKREVLLDYEEHFMDGKNQGRTEEEICAALGDPKKIAEDIKNQSVKSASNTEGLNMAGYIIGIILLGIACIALVSILFSVLGTAISGIFGAVAVTALFSNTMIRIAAISAIIFVIAICVLIALGIIKLIPIIVKWFKQMKYSIDGRYEEAKTLQPKKIKIHAIVWILLSVLCVASICGMIVGGVGAAKDIMTNTDVEDIRQIEDFFYNVTYSHRYYDEEFEEYFEDGAVEFEDAMEEWADGMEEWADDMEDWADDMEDKYGRRSGFYWWRYVFGN